MKVGLIVASDDSRELDPRRRLAEHVERAVAARDAGFDMITFTHRYSFGPSAGRGDGDPLVTSRFQPIPLIAHIAAHLGDTVDYATLILLASPSHPVQLAEDIATLDAMTGGRLVLGMGLGWMPYELEAFGIDPGTRGHRFEELVRALRLLLTSDDVTFEGEHFRFRDARVVARPARAPDASVPIWIGGSKPGAVRRAARVGDAWSMTAHASVDELTEQLGIFERERERVGLPMPTDRPLNRVLHIAKDSRTAYEEARPALAAWYRSRQDSGWSIAKGVDGPVEEEIIGGPQECLEQILALRERFGVTHLSFDLPGPLSTQAIRMRTIELLGNHVIPHLR